MKITVTEKFDEQGRVVERITVYGEGSEVPSHREWWFRPEPVYYPFPDYSYPYMPYTVSGSKVFMSQTPDGKVRTPPCGEVFLCQTPAEES